MRADEQTVTAAELGPLLQRFDVDPTDQRVLAFVRRATATMALLGGLVLLLAKVPIAVFLAALLAVAISALWLAQARRASHMAADAVHHHLSLFRDGFVLAQGAQTETIRWADVTQVYVDEERLDIVVIRHHQPPLRLEPRYAGVEIHQLVHTLRNAAGLEGDEGLAPEV